MFVGFPTLEHATYSCPCQNQGSQCCHAVRETSPRKDERGWEGRSRYHINMGLPTHTYTWLSGLTPLCCHRVSETYRWKDGKGWWGERMCCPYTAYGRRTDEVSIGFTLSFEQMHCNCNCNLLFISFPSHQVSIFTHMHSVHFSAFSMHYIQCTSRSWRHTNTYHNTDIMQ
jgi:hypothetical protein